MRLKNRIALITGASKGIGAAIAKRFAQEGSKLILIARNTKALEELDDALAAYDAESVLVPFDIKNFEGFYTMAKSIKERFGFLDILVGNAGVLGQLRPLSDISASSWHQTFDVNLNANWHLLKAFDPLLKLSKAGRAIFITANEAEETPPYRGAYSVSKAALNALVLTYAKENAHTALRVNLVNPVAVRTDLRAEAMPGEDPLSLPSPIDITNVFVELAGEECQSNGQIVNAVNIATDIFKN